MQATLQPAMQPALKPHLSNFERVSLKDAAEMLGLTESGARARFRRGELQGERDNSGKIWVYVAPAMQPTLQPAKQPHKSNDSEAILRAQLEGLSGELEQVKSERDDLRRRLDQSEAERREKDRQLAAILTEQTQQPAAEPEAPAKRRGWRAILHRLAG